jgi:hypothetical protein
MALLIPDNLKSRGDVPNAIQRVLNSFEVGFDDNVTIWYEPLFDPSGEKPHLVVLIPERGIVILEVLDVKKGSVLGALRGNIRIIRHGEEKEIRNPLVRAENLASILIQRIQDEERLSGISIPVSAGAVFPYLSMEESKEKGVSSIIKIEKCIFRETIDIAIKGEGEAKLLRSIIKMLDSNMEYEVPRDKEKILRGIIQPETVIDKVNYKEEKLQLRIFIPPGDGKDIIRVMDRKQESMAKSLGSGHRIIRGVAGSGKTLILVFRAKLIARVFPQKKILVACYNRTLASQLRAYLNEFSNVEVKHVDRIMADSIRQMGWKHPGFRDDDSGDKVAKMAIEAQNSGAGPRYDYVLLDEAQDFGTSQLRFIKGLLKTGCDELLIVADAAQNIFRRKFSWKEAGIKATGRTQILQENYRNTKEILEFAMKFLMYDSEVHQEEVPDFEDEDAIIPPKAAARSGPTPIVHLCNEYSDEVELAIAQAKEWNPENQQARKIAIAYPTSIVEGVERAKIIYERLKEEGIGVYWLTNPDDREARDKLENVSDPVILSTIFSLKGLEFPYIVICGVWRDDFDKVSNRRVAYVGMTRATDYLAVISTQGNPLVSALQFAKENSE